MNKLFFLALFGLFIFGAGCSGSRSVFTPTETGGNNKQSTSNKNLLVTDASLLNWQSIDAGTFTLSLPPGWKFNKLQGIDSYVGEFIGNGAKLEFDYGWYSSSLAEDTHLTHASSRSW